MTISFRLAIQGSVYHSKLIQNQWGPAIYPETKVFKINMFDRRAQVADSAYIDVRIDELSEEEKRTLIIKQVFYAQRSTGFAETEDWRMGEIRLPEVIRSYFQNEKPKKTAERTYQVATHGIFSFGRFEPQKEGGYSFVRQRESYPLSKISAQDPRIRLLPSQNLQILIDNLSAEEKRSLTIHNVHYSVNLGKDEEWRFGDIQLPVEMRASIFTNKA